MPKRIPVQTIFVQRNGKNFKPPLGQIFDFTVEELADINSVNPAAVRKPTVETETAVDPVAGSSFAAAEAAAAEAAAAEAAAAEAAAAEAAAAQPAAQKQGSKGGKKSTDASDL